MNSNILYLTKDELRKLKTIGYGTDGMVYKYKNNLLVKIYHSNPKSTFTSRIDLKNDEDVKIYSKGQKIKSNYYENCLNYFLYNNEEIKILPKEALFKAIERQKNIDLTSLPLGVVYLNNKFAGCILKRHYGIQLHKLMFLPLEKRKSLFLKILKANRELLENNIYHRDLANSPYVKKDIILPNKTIVKSGHSHILVNPLNKDINIIDLDGKSTVYTEKHNEKYLLQNALNLNILALEFLFKLDYEEYKENLEDLYPEFDKYEIKLSTIEKILSMNIMQDELESVVKTLKMKRGKNE